MVDYSKVVDRGGEDIALKSIMYSSGPMQAQTHMIYGNGSVPATSASGTPTITASNIFGGMVSLTGTTPAITFDTAANIVAYLNANYSGANVGDTIQVTVGSLQAATISSFGSGNTVTTNGSGAIAAASQKDFWFVVTNVTTPACTVYV